MQVAVSELTIRVLRNQNGPVFSPARYDETIADTYQVGGVVLKVTANDADGVSILLSFQPYQTEWWLHISVKNKYAVCKSMQASYILHFPGRHTLNHDRKSALRCRQTVLVNCGLTFVKEVKNLYM